MFSSIVRRTHMYLALFLGPWVVMYTLSTIAMNHREHLRGIYGQGPPEFRRLDERPYSGVFPSGATPRQQAVQILRDLGMDGAHTAGKPAADGTLTINRHDPVHPKRLLYRPSDGVVTIEEMVFQMPAFLERMHRRRGFQQDYVTDDAWAVSVDLFIVAMIFWFASGLWMWWEMRVTRRWGAAFALAGLGLFTLFLVTI